MLDIVRAFLEEGTTEYHGEFFDFGPTGMYPKPSHPVPIWVGGKTPVALARAARQDGWLGMNYPMEEIEALLPALSKARKSQAELDGAEKTDFETIVIPLAEPTEALYEDLEKRGVTGTVCAPWGLGDPTYDSESAKIDALATFAERFIRA
jgi:alkanesulfonate monooxygenase SsuD/methylene tetrahydromethanopterin reductase-like flavin-dependent oxidoreductase (luciferase family)